MEWFSEVSTTEWIIVVILLLVIIVQVKDILFPTPQSVPVPLVKEKKKVVQRDFTLEELKEFTGANEKPIYLCAKGVVYDLSDGASFYGPGGPYAVFAGHDASRCLATVSTSAEDLDLSLEGLTAEELRTLDQWCALYDGKYTVVGRVPNAPSLVKVATADKKNA